MKKVSQEEIKDAKALTEEGNMEILRKLVRFWDLGPEKAYSTQEENKAFWKKLSKSWFITEKAARRRTCGNCEYGKTTPAYLKAMEHIPYNIFDNDGGGRVWCAKFDFICHNLRTCKRWE